MIMTVKLYELCDNWFVNSGSRTQQTRPGSYGINNSHLAGIQATKSDPSDRVVQNFCIKTSYIADGDYQWEKGMWIKFECYLLRQVHHSLISYCYKLFKTSC